jgi:hypothetical protein
MRKIALVAVVAFLLGLAVAIATTILRPSLLSRESTPPPNSALSPTQVEKLMLYAALNDGQLSGKFFNQNADITITQITIEAAPKDEGNPFNKFAPRFFNVIALAPPRTMSSEFRVETGALNPDFHTLRVTEAKGVSLRE